MYVQSRIVSAKEFLKSEMAKAETWKDLDRNIQVLFEGQLRSSEYLEARFKAHVKLVARESVPLFGQR
jgi:hypothetical protein